MDSDTDHEFDLQPARACNGAAHPPEDTDLTASAIDEQADQALPQLTDDDITEGVHARDHADVDESRELLLRHAKDAHMFSAIQASGFVGRNWDLLSNELSRYGLAVTTAWLRSGHIFALSANKGRGVSPSDTEREQLRDRNSDTAEEVAQMVVMRAVLLFRAQALKGRGWKPDGGAAITTYFMGACVLAFASEYRRFQTEWKRWTIDRGFPPDNLDPNTSHHRLATSIGNPASIVDTDTLAHEMNTLSETDRTIVWLADNGYDQDEIAEICNLSSRRAVEGRLYRLRKQHRDRRRTWQQGGTTT